LGGGSQKGEKAKEKGNKKKEKLALAVAVEDLRTDISRYFLDFRKRRAHKSLARRPENRHLRKKQLGQRGEREKGCLKNNSTA